MNIREYFPLSKAYGKAFCNRTEESKWLLENVKACKHSLLIGPRRFGKSSLTEKVIEQAKMPANILNFNICSDETEIEQLIRHGVSQLIGKCMGPTDKLLHSLKNQLNYLKPKISMGVSGAEFSLELASQKKIPISLSVEESLMVIEKLLAKKNERAILVLDEFQTVGLIAKGSGVEAAIRNSAQEMSHLAIIFSGSIRGLLKSMFENKSKPLYKICRKLNLGRIAEPHYEKHLNYAAKSIWNQVLPNDVFQKIMSLTERHPYYVNYLCDVLWANNKNLPNEQAINKAWEQVIEEERSDGNAEIAQLSLGQKKVLKYIATHQNLNLTSSETVQATGLGASSISAALAVLIKKDIIEKEEDQYLIINPIIAYLLREGPK